MNRAWFSVWIVIFFGYEDFDKVDCKALAFVEWHDVYALAERDDVEYLVHWEVVEGEE